MATSFNFTGSDSRPGRAEDATKVQCRPPGPGQADHGRWLGLEKLAQMMQRELAATAATLLLSCCRRFPHLQRA